MKDEGLVYLSRGAGKQNKVCGLPKLVILKLNGLVEMTDLPLVHIAEVFTSVEVMELARCEHLTEVGIEKVLKFMPNLKLIDLNMIPEVKAEFLEEFTQNPKFGVTIKR